MSTAEIAAGVAEVDITPGKARLAGQFHERFSTGTHDPLKARAIVMEHGADKFAFVFSDLVDVPVEVSDLVRLRASETIGVPVGHSFISASHTHTGPEYHGVRRDYYHSKAIGETGEDPYEDGENPYSLFLADKFLQAVHTANNNLQPVELQVGIAHQDGLSYNRHYQARALGTKSFNRNGDEEAWPIDPDVGIMVIHAKDSGVALGGLTVFACHPDSLGGTEFSADYPYYLEQSLQAEFGDSYISAFAQGASADINHVAPGSERPYKGESYAKKIGQGLGNTVLASQHNLTTIAKPSFAAAKQTVAVPLQDYEEDRLEEALGNFSMLSDERGDFDKKIWSVKTVDLHRLHSLYGQSLPLEVQAFRLDDDTAMVSLPGEVFADLSLAVKEESPFEKTLVATISNDRPSYFPTEQAFDKGDYGEAVSRVKRGSGETLAVTAINLLYELKNS